MRAALTRFVLFIVIAIIQYEPSPPKLSEFPPYQRETPSTHYSPALKIRAQVLVGNTTISAAAVLLVNGPEVTRRVVLLLQDSSGNGNNVLFAILGVLQKGGRPGVPSRGAAGEEDSCCSHLGRKVVKQRK